MHEKSWAGGYQSIDKWQEICLWNRLWRRLSDFSSSGAAPVFPPPPSHILVVDGILGLIWAHIWTWVNAFQDSNTCHCISCSFYITHGRRPYKRLNWRRSLPRRLQCPWKSAECFMQLDKCPAFRRLTGWKCDASCLVVIPCYGRARVYSAPCTPNLEGQFCALIIPCMHLC